MKLSYQIIRKIHRLEKESSKLVKLEADFFESLKEFLEDEKNKIKQNDDLFDDSASQRLFNIRSMVEDIINLRQKKVINNAIVYLKTSEEDFSGFLTPERKMFKEVSKSLAEYQNYIKTIFGNKKTKSKYNLVKIRIVKEIPKFIGTDMQEYGPYKDGETVEIPESIAKLFVNKGIGDSI